MFYSIISWTQSVKCKWNGKFTEFSEWPKSSLYIQGLSLCKIDSFEQMIDQLKYFGGLEAQSEAEFPISV